jgi:hypothetical protein
MCVKCSDIDAKMARYQRLSTMVIEHGALESIKRLIANLAAERAYLHSRPEKQLGIQTSMRARVIDFGGIRAERLGSRDRELRG